MGTEVRPSDPDLIRRLLAEAPRFSFFQVVSILSRTDAQAAPVGHLGPTAEESLRFRPALSFAFPASSVSGIEVQRRLDGRDRYLVEVTFLGLYGAETPLPTCYTEDLLREELDSGSLVRDFLDLFHHRLLSLFYRAWQKYRYHVQFERGARDAFSRRVLALMGLGGASASASEGVPRERWLRYAGQLGHSPCSAELLRGVIRDYFGGIPVRIESWGAGWSRVAPEFRTCLGISSSILGESLQIGERVPDRARRFRVALGPLPWAEFLGFLPGERNRGAILEVVRIFADFHLEFDVELLPRREEVPPLRLGTGEPARLGWTTWLGTPEATPSIILDD